MKDKKGTFIIIGICLTIIIMITFLKKVNKNDGQVKIGQIIDSLNGVKVYNNGFYSNISGRNRTKDGYNLGLKYQCVEFVKRYYYEYYNHKMPDSYGNAKDFFERKIKDGGFNSKRGLIQYSNPSSFKPRVDDILIFDASIFNKFGHVAIISKVTDKKIEILQQNGGSSTNTRESFELNYKNGKWEINNYRILGRLRK